MIDIEKLRKKKVFLGEPAQDVIEELLDELQAAREKIERLREKIARQAEEIKELNSALSGVIEQTRVQAEELELLRALLEQSRKNFGIVEIHGEDCEYAYEEDENVPCDCGAREYYDALKACDEWRAKQEKKG